MKWRRVILAILIAGLLSIVDWFLITKGGRSISILFIVERSLIGFVIGISGIRWHYLINGAVIGCVMSIPYAIGSGSKFYIPLIIGILYGVIVELVVSGIFRFRN